MQGNVGYPWPGLVIHNHQPRNTSNTQDVLPCAVVPAILLVHTTRSVPKTEMYSFSPPLPQIRDRAMLLATFVIHTYSATYLAGVQSSKKCWNSLRLIFPSWSRSALLRSLLHKHTHTRAHRRIRCDGLNEISRYRQGCIRLLLGKVEKVCRNPINEVIR